MFERQLMIAGLQKQYDLLLGLIQEIENKPKLDLSGGLTFDRETKRVANNLRRLRKIKANYFQSLS